MPTTSQDRLKALLRLLKSNEALLLLVALSHGLLWRLLYGLEQNDFWPSGDYPWQGFFYTALYTAPLLLLLALEPAGRGRVIGLVGLFTGLVASLAYYAGTQLGAADSTWSDTDAVMPLFILFLLVAAFKALMYIQHFGSGEGFSYSALFRRSWRNFLITGLALAFTGAFRLILLLWQWLFKEIGIDFFDELFNEAWFIYPVMSVAFGIGVIILRRLSQIIDTVAQIQQMLMRILLPLLVFISVLFLLALLFTGLAPLWESGGSFTVLWILLLTLFFVNAVYKDDPEAMPYPLWAHRLVYAGVAVLPVYSAISCYGISLRVMEYGWSVARGLAFALWAVLTLFALGYCYSILRRGDRWLHGLSRINVVMGLVVMATVLLLNSPLLDLRKISTNSQMARLDSGQTSLQLLDIGYFARELARPGYEAMQSLKQQLQQGAWPGDRADAVTGAEAAGNEAIADAIDGAIRRIDLHYHSDYADPADEAGEAFSAQRVPQILQEMGVVAGDYPESLVAAVRANLHGKSPASLASGRFHFFPVDLDRDGESEYLLLVQGLSRLWTPEPETEETDDTDGTFRNYILFYRDDEETNFGWSTRILSARGFDESTIERLRQGDFRVAPPTPPRWGQIQVGDATIN